VRWYRRYRLASDEEDDDEVLEIYDVDKLPGYTPLKMREGYDRDDHRPHGFAIYDEAPFTPSDSGVVETRDFASKHQWIGPEDRRKLWNYDGYIAYAIGNASEKVDFDVFDESRMFFHDGWDSSYHDAHWTGHMVIGGLGATPDEATKNLRDAFHTLEPEDTAQRRLYLRSLVRPGD